MNALTGDVARSKKEEFSSHLLRWRTERDWSREESAAKLGVSRRTLQEWEQGRRVPSEMAQRGVFARMQEIERGNVA